MQEIAGLRLLGRIHDGARSAVFRAERPDGTPVILKTIQDTHPSPGQVAELRREHRLLSSLDSGFVVRSHGTVPHGNGLALVLEDIGAVAVSEYLRNGPPPLAVGLRIGRDAAAALEAVHARGIVHKDIKPANLVVNPRTLELRLIDFNISSRLEEETTEAAGVDSIEGTLAYISPEQTGRMNRPIDHRSDLYSFGVLLFELLSGHLPYDSTDPLELLHCHCARTPSPLQNFAPAVPAVLGRIVARLLSKDAEDRYQSARGLRIDLDRCLALLAGDSIPDFEPAIADGADRLRLSHRLYGRTAALDALQDAFAAARVGSRLLLVAGGPGVGKSALIREVARPIAAARGYFVEGKFDQFDRNRPYASLIQALQGLVRQLLGESPVRVGGWKASILDALGPNVGLIAQIIPEVALVVGEHAPPPTLPPTEARNRFDDTFLRFLRVFARPGAPLALFLDDLQWVDSGSLRLLQALVTDPDLSGLLIVGTYRDNEVDPAHPLARALASVKDAGVQVDSVELDALEPKDIAALLCDSMHCSPEDAAPLADLLGRKTGGNPFFVRQFLTSLHAEGLLHTDREGGSWVWNLARIEERSITDNVAELLTDRMRELPDATAQLVQLAACLGNNLTLGQLALAAESSVPDVGRDLWPAIQAGHLLPLSREHRWLQESRVELDSLAGLRLRFQHDRVQQAAYHLADDATRRPIHLRIARRLHRDLTDGDSGFVVARHYGAALELITDPAERDAAAAIHLRAGRAARRSNAYEPAQQLLDRGLALVADRTVLRDLQVERGVCACLLGDRDAAKSWFEQALAASADPLDRVDVRAEWIQALLNEGDHAGVVALGRDSLIDLGQPVPMDPDEARGAGIGALQAALGALGDTGAFGLLDRPAMTDRRSRALANTLGMVSPSAYIRDPEEGQFLWVAANGLQLMLDAGTSAESAHGCSLVGMVLYVVGQRALARDFLRVGVLLGERDGDPMARARATTCESFYGSRKGTLDEAVNDCRNAWERCLEAGDWFHAGWAAWTLMNTQSLAGVAPATAVAEAEAYLRFLRPRAPELEPVCEAILRKNLALLGLTEGPTSFAGPDFDEDAFEAGIRRRGMEVEVGTYGVQRAWLLALFGAWAEAEASLNRADEVFATLTVFNVAFEAKFLRGLARAGQGDAAGIHEALAAMEPWVEDEPRSFGPYDALLRAELAALSGDLNEAIAKYDRCVDVSGMHPMIRALAQERAGRLLVGSRRDRFARVYLADARNAWELLGVVAKVEQLKDEFPDRALTVTTGTLRAVRPDETLSATFQALPPTLPNNLDLETFARAARAIASEVELEGLLRTLLRLAVENAGATAGALVTWEAGEPRLRARAVARTELEITTVDEALSRTHVVPRSVILQVGRLEEVTLIADSKDALRFARDPYFLVHERRSVAALPMVHGGRLSGVLYLENDHGTGAFTPARTELLTLLSSQAAIALENARLYEETRAALEHVRRLNEAHRRFVPRELLTALGKRSVLDVELGEHVRGTMAVLFADIRGFTTLSEQLGADRTFDFINRYLASAGPVVRNCGGYIDKYIGDAIMAVFPRCADDALDAAVALHAAVERFNVGWFAEGHDPISIGVGVHVGDVVLGTVGEVERMEGTVISDAVNVASRLEGQCKTLDVGIVASAEVFAACKDPTRQPRRALGDIRVKGRARPLTVFELVVAGRKTA